MTIVLVGAACFGVGMAVGSAWAMLKQGNALDAEYHRGIKVGFDAGRNAVGLSTTAEAPR